MADVKRTILLHSLIAEKTDAAGDGGKKGSSFDDKLNHMMNHDLSEASLRGDLRKFTCELPPEKANDPKYSALIRTEDNHTNNIGTLAEQVVPNILLLFQDRLNLHADVEYGSTMARASVIVDDKVLIEDAPAHMLLLLRKDIAALYDAIKRLPELPRDVNWTWSEAMQCWQSPVKKTARTQPFKAEVIINKLPDGMAWPAGYSPVVRPVETTEVLGTIEVQSFSGRLNRQQKDALLKTIDKIQAAVQEAIRTANSTEVRRLQICNPIITMLSNAFATATASINSRS